MSIYKTYDIGPNSGYVFYYPNQTTLLELINVICSWLYKHGWTMHATTANGIILKSLCQDGTTVKYMGLSTNTSGNPTGIVMQVYKSWNPTQSVVYLDYFSSPSTATMFEAQQINISSGGRVYMFATARYCIIYTKNNDGTVGGNISGSWSGCLEFSPDVRDNRNIIRYGFTSGYHLSSGYTSSLQGRSTTVQYSAPSSQVRSDIFNQVQNSIWYGAMCVVTDNTNGIRSCLVNVGTCDGVTTIIPLYQRTTATYTSGPSRFFSYTGGSNEVTLSVNLQAVDFNTGNIISTYASTQIVPPFYPNASAALSLYNTFVQVETAHEISAKIIRPSKNVTDTTLAPRLTARTLLLYTMGNTSSTFDNVTSFLGKLNGVATCITDNTLNLFDTVNIQTDEQGNFVDSGGLVTPYIVLDPVRTTLTPSTANFIVPL